VRIPVAGAGRKAAVAAILMACAACGGSGGGGGSPIAPSTGSPGVSGATITIGANGAVSPTQVTIGVGQSVTFVNSDNRSHDMASDPHPSHGQCPSINTIGLIAPGQTKVTNGFGGAGSCGYHDHNDPDNNALKGRVVIQ
jgi:plastocyanin